MEVYKIKPPRPTLITFNIVQPLFSLSISSIVFLFKTKLLCCCNKHSDNSYIKAATGAAVPVHHIAFTFCPLKSYSNITTAALFFSTGTCSIFLYFDQRGKFQWDCCC